MIGNSLTDNLWIPGQRLTKERKQLRNELLKRLCAKINADLKHLFENKKDKHTHASKELF